MGHGEQHHDLASSNLSQVLDSSRPHSLQHLLQSLTHPLLLQQLWVLLQQALLRLTAAAAAALRLLSSGVARG